MESFELYKIATKQYHKAMNYHNAISNNGRLTGKKEFKKNTKERKQQQEEYEKALFYYKLYKSIVRLEEREYRR